MTPTTPIWYGLEARPFLLPPRDPVGTPVAAAGAFGKAGGRGPAKMHAGEIETDETLVRRLLAG